MPKKVPRKRLQRKMTPRATAPDASLEPSENSGETQGETKSEVKPVDTGPRYEGIWQVLFERGRKGTPDWGSLSDIRPGDAIGYYEKDSGHHTDIVHKLLGSKWTRRIQTEAQTYHGYVVRKSVTLEVSDIYKLLRLKPGERSLSLEDMEKEQEQNN